MTTVAFYRFLPVSIPGFIFPDKYCYNPILQMTKTQMAHVTWPSWALVHPGVCSCLNLMVAPLLWLLVHSELTTSSAAARLHHLLLADP
jgi:hypothetical protein